MIGRIGGASPATAEQVNPQEKAALIYAQARAELSGRLWKAALGGDASASPTGTDRAESGDMGLDALVALLGGDGMPKAISPAPAPPPSPPPADPDGHSSHHRSQDGDVAAGGLGANAPYAATLSAAAERTGLPPALLATIVQAEAATGADGRWLTFSRNPRSSAAGLGQFLSGTWISEAERPGTWLHQIAGAQGWLNGHGRVSSDARSALLQLRYDGDTAIQAIADYARSNLDQLRNAGVAVGTSIESLAQSAYLGHHLGMGDAIRFLKGELSPDRAHKLLKAQIGGAAADQRIAEAGDATRAHRMWLLGYVAHAVQPERFAVLSAAKAGRNA
jgi:hypothetical protein